ncbi:MAG TPA: GntR family transcriptional regulator [Phenylobacterium sp.]|nr:GntR family transcriptional regulator [Phenylobacterium sp.]
MSSIAVSGLEPQAPRGAVGGSLLRSAFTRESGAGPLYVQLEQTIRAAIETGILKPGDTIPPERDLAKMLAISRVTVRRALRALATAGIVEQRRGAGTRIAGQLADRAKHEALPHIPSFSEELRNRGHVANSRWLRRTKGIVSPREALGLSLSPGSGVFRLERVRSRDGIPLAIETATIPADLLLKAEAVEESLYEALGAHRPVRVLQRIRAVVPSSEQAARLELAAPAACLLVDRRGFSSSGRVVEFTRSCIRGDAYDLVSEIGGPD